MATGKDSANPIRVYVLNDHELVRRGLRDLLSVEADVQIVGGSSRARQARAQILSLRPDVAVLDARLPDGSGIEVCRDVRALDPSIRALILTSYDNETALFASIVADASGFVVKQISGSSLVDSIRLVAAGASTLDPASVAQVQERMQQDDLTRGRFDSLSPQEGRVLALIAEGLTNRQIGERLSLAEKTIKNYVSVILTKLGLQRCTQAAVLSAQVQEPEVDPVRPTRDITPVGHGT